MNDFKDIILKTKKISIWGAGYLGYTTTLRLQDSGFTSTIYDFNGNRLDGLINGSYPNKEQLNSWSKNGKIPSLDFKKIDIAKDIDLLFQNTIHIISFPNTKNYNYKEIATTFIQNKEQLKDSLVIFQSAGIPKAIEKEFCAKLLGDNINIDVSTAFRSDWTIESFLNDNSRIIVSGNSERATSKTKTLLSLLNLNSITLSDIEEAEIYANTKNALNYTIVAFFNQLSLAYPHMNINKLSNSILQDFYTSNLSLGVSSVDYKSEQSIENLLRGSSQDFLSILKEANNTNISFLFYYVDLLKTKNIKSVTILGLSSYNSMKDLGFSPSIMLAEYLYKEGIKVCVYDENFTEDEVVKFLPYCDYININAQSIQTEAVFVMNLSKEFKYFTQDMLDDIGISKVKYLLDNTGFFKDFSYSDNTVYHQLCDENLINIIN